MGSGWPLRLHWPGLGPGSPSSLAVKRRARDAVARITAVRNEATVDVLMADLSSQRSVRRLAAEVLVRYPRLDVLINNAGAMYTRRRLTEDGIELTWCSTTWPRFYSRTCCWIG